MAGMNAGFAAYLANKKKNTGAPAPAAAPAPVGKKPVAKGKGPIDPKMKLNAKHASIQQRAQAY